MQNQITTTRLQPRRTSATGRTAVLRKRKKSIIIAVAAVLAAAACVAIVFSVTAWSPWGGGGQAQIVFSGGTDSGSGNVYQNPSDAHVQVSGSDVTASGWWITKAGSDAILYESDGDNVSGTLLLMQDYGMTGEYVITFFLTDESGNVYTTYGNFYIGQIES